MSATAIKRRKGTTAEHSAFTGLAAELTVDTTKNTVVVHDGATAGGYPLAKETGNTTLDTTNLEVTNIKAKDGTAAMSIADSTGVVSLTANPVLSGGTANGVLYLNGSKVATSGSALSFDGTNLGVGGAAGNSINYSTITVRGTTGGVYEFNTGATLQSYILGNSAELRLQTQSTQAITFVPNGSEQMRLTSTGLGIGTSSPSVKLDVNGSGAFRLPSIGGSVSIDFPSFAATNAKTRLLATGTSDYRQTFKIQMNTAQSDSAPVDVLTIDNSGNLLVGTTSAAAKVTVRYSSAGSGVDVQNASNPTTGGVIHAGTLQAGSASEYLFVGQYGNGSVITTNSIFIRTNGNLQNINNSYGSLSDIKLKENIVDATPKLEKLNQVRVVNFNMVGSEQKQLGVIAQELEQIFPGMVDETPDRDAKGNDLGTTTKAVKYSVFVPMLIKAIQEQQAIIESLKSRLDAANL